MATKEVTANKILDLLPIVADKKWTIDSGLIRDEDARCPICSIVHEIDPTISLRTSAAYSLKELGIDVGIHNREVHFVMNAADNVFPNQTTMEIRNRMIEILNPEVIG